MRNAAQFFGGLRPQEQPAAQRDCKVKDPEPFKGEPEDLERFLLQLENKFAMEPVRYGDDVRKIRYAGQLMKDRAHKWYRSYHLQISLRDATRVHGPVDLDPRFANWDLFEASLRATVSLTSRPSPARPISLNLGAAPLPAESWQRPYVRDPSTTRGLPDPRFVSLGPLPPGSAYHRPQPAGSQGTQLVCRGTAQGGAPHLVGGQAVTPQGGAVSAPRPSLSAAGAPVTAVGLGRVTESRGPAEVGRSQRRGQL
jgi:hypothetical protein